MAFVMRLAGQGFTSEKYDEVVRRLETAEEGSPAGRLFHVAFGDKENLRISDVWDTRENFDRFFAVVGGIMQEMGISGSEPEFYEVHNYIVGEEAASAAG
jgi:hypothetical protein